MTNAKRGDIIAVHTATMHYAVHTGIRHIVRIELARAEKVVGGIVKTFVKGNTAIGRVDKSVCQIYTMPADKMRLEDFWAAHKDSEWKTLADMRDAAWPFRTDLGTPESLGA